MFNLEAYEGGSYSNNTTIKAKWSPFFLLLARAVQSLPCHGMNYGCSSLAPKEKPPVSPYTGVALWLVFVAVAIIIHVACIDCCVLVTVK